MKHTPVLAPDFNPHTAVFRAGASHRALTAQNASETPDDGHGNGAASTPHALLLASPPDNFILLNLNKASTLTSLASLHRCYSSDRWWHKLRLVCSLLTNTSDLCVWPLACLLLCPNRSPSAQMPPPHARCVSVSFSFSFVPQWNPASVPRETLAVRQYG